MANFHNVPNSVRHFVVNFMPYATTQMQIWRCLNATVKLQFSFTKAMFINVNVCLIMLVFQVSNLFPLTVSVCVSLSVLVSKTHTEIVIKVLTKVPFPCSHRKVQTESPTGSVGSSRVRTTLTLSVETIDFDSQACQLRVKGTNLEENQYVKVRDF